MTTFVYQNSNGPYEMPTYLTGVKNQLKNVVLIYRGRALYINILGVRDRLKVRC